MSEPQFYVLKCKRQKFRFSILFFGFRLPIFWYLKLFCIIDIERPEEDAVKGSRKSLC